MKPNIVDVIYGKRVHRMEKVEVHGDGLGLAADVASAASYHYRLVSVCIYISFCLYLCNQRMERFEDQQRRR